MTDAIAVSKKRLHGRMVVLALCGGIAFLAAMYFWIWPRSAVVAGPTGQPLTSVALPPEPSVAAGGASLGSLREQVQRYPRDGRGWVLLAIAAVEANDYAQASEAFEKAVAVSSKVAADPGVLCDWADALGMAQGGSLKGRPTELISRALALRSDYPKALEMAGSAAYEDGKFALAAEYWSRLLTQMPEGTLGRRALEAGIARARGLTSSPPGK